MYNNLRMMGLIRRRWKLILVILVLTGASFWFWKSRAATQKNTKVTTSRAVKGDFIKSVTSSGKTTADKTVTLRFQTSGRLAWVGVKEGDTVSAYQAIAGLDVREVSKNLEKTLRDYAAARDDFEETYRVTYKGMKPQDALTDTVKRILEKNQWDLEQAVLDVELKSLAVEYATLVSPISGTVTHIDTPVAGVNITPAGSEFEISDLSTLRFEAKVDEVDIGGLEIGRQAVISLDAFPDATYSGTISSMSYVSELSSGGATVFPVKINFSPPANSRIGLNGDVSFDLVRMDDVVMVPTEAIREDGNRKYLYISENGYYRKVYVETGPRNESVVVVTSGITDGNEVVTKGFNDIPKLQAE
ncbi:hypothetical protein A2Z33_02720 [Candidatus Gottesmanbacteria bacterium RBG_16_52_11]|uniref:CzcB-like C-terminal circularly permuted SH3-like domain-containing protein n=1 Tax=Candidatus Gottesmanbacteria bacterium RBG_16_52_11 TaxID=1798374 RepID=A0A1F5YMP8_9BACT|nr:MAG: hypothetical protein A2Z33_02720 [Candidatus Gottesmanbacteria bacterium RBG_16_52_11]